MPFQAILREVDQLNNVSMRLDALAEQHPVVSEPLTTIAVSVRNTATLLAAAKGPKPIRVRKSAQSKVIGHGTVQAQTRLCLISGSIS